MLFIFIILTSPVIIKDFKLEVDIASVKYCYVNILLQEEDNKITTEEIEKSGVLCCLPTNATRTGTARGRRIPGSITR